MARHKAHSSWIEWKRRKAAEEKKKGVGRRMSQYDREAAWAGAEIREEEDDGASRLSNEEQQPRSCTQCIKEKIVDSSEFQMLVAVVILANVIIMAIQADYPKLGPGYEWLWPAVNWAFLLFFTGELVLRFIVSGFVGFFCHGTSKEGQEEDDADEDAVDEISCTNCMEAMQGDELPWNYFDFTVILLGWLDVLSKFFLPNHNQKSSKVVQIIRVVRILRIMRVIRLFKQLRKLRMLVRGLVESLGIIFWISVMMVVMILIMAIFCTSTVGHKADLWGDEADLIVRYFGTVPNSFQTLFQYLTLDDWGAISRVVSKQMPLMMPIFMLYVVLSAFVVLSLLTGVMAEHMNAVREMEEDEDKREQHHKRQETTRSFYQAFMRLPLDSRKRVNKQEFRVLYDDDLFKKDLEKYDFKMDTIECDDLFDCLDLDNDGYLNWEEFKYGMMELREAVAPKQIIVLRNKITRAMDDVKSRDDTERDGTGSRGPAKHPEVKEWRSWVEGASRSMQSAERRLDDMQDLMDEFIQYCKVDDSEENSST